MKKNLFLSLLYVFFNFNINSLAGTNLGHRAGSSSFKGLPDNSLIALEASLKGTHGMGPIQKEKKFYYLEFDVRETKDKSIVVFHDNYISKMIPNQGANKAAIREILLELNRENKSFRKSYGDLRIKDLTIAQIKTLRLKGQFDQQVPTLDEFFRAIKKFSISKPVVVEIKSFHSDEGKLKLIAKVKKFKKEYMD